MRSISIPQPGVSPAISWKKLGQLCPLCIETLQSSSVWQLVWNAQTQTCATHAKSTPKIRRLKGNVQTNMLFGASIRGPIKFPSCHTAKVHFWLGFRPRISLLRHHTPCSVPIVMEHVGIHDTKTKHIIPVRLHLVTSQKARHSPRGFPSFSHALHLLAQVADGRYLLIFSCSSLFFWSCLIEILQETLVSTADKCSDFVMVFP